VSNKDVIDFVVKEYVVIYQGPSIIGTLKRHMNPKSDSRFRFHPHENLNWLSEDVLRTILRYVQENPRRTE